MLSLKVRIISSRDALNAFFFSRHSFPFFVLLPSELHFRFESWLPVPLWRRCTSPGGFQDTSRMSREFRIKSHPPFVLRL